MDNFTATSSASCPNDTVCLLEVICVIAVTVLILISSVAHLALLLSTPSFRNSHGYLLISLSVADFGVGAVAALSVYPSATLQGRADSWPYGDGLCLVASYATLVFTANSGYTLTLLSVERYVAVAHPLRYARFATKKGALVAIAVGWVYTSSVFASTFAGHPHHKYAPEVYACLPAFTMDSVFALIMVFAMILPSLILILVTSVRISRKLEEHARRRAQMTANIRPPSASVDSSRGTSRKSIQLFKMVRIMTMAIYLSWLPFLVVIVLKVFFNVVVPQVVAFTTYWLLLSNSFINGIIYYAMNTTFRERIYELTGKKVPSCCLKLEDALEKIACTRCSCVGHAETYSATSGDNTTPQGRISQINSPNDSNVELVMIKTAQANRVANQGFIV